MTDLTEQVRAALRCKWCCGAQQDAMGHRCKVCRGLGYSAPTPAAVARALNQISHSPMCRGRHGEECRCNRAGDIRAALAALRERR